VAVQPIQIQLKNSARSFQNIDTRKNTQPAFRINSDFGTRHREQIQPTTRPGGVEASSSVTRRSNPSTSREPSFVARIPSNQPTGTSTNCHAVSRQNDPATTQFELPLPSSRSMQITNRRDPATVAQ